MKFETLLSPYKHFTLAKASDNEEILDFFKTITMDTESFSLRYDRGSDFFAFSKEQSDKYFIVLMRDEKNIIRGCANIALIPHMMNGKNETCAYLGDLRISPLLPAKIRLLWKKCYSDMIEHFHVIEEFENVKYLYTAILDENKNAMRSLLKNDNFIYHPLTPYETFNIVRPFPFASLTNKRFVTAPISFSEALDFVRKNHSNIGLANHSAELERRVNTWKNFSDKSFIAVKNKTKGEILAIVAPWECTTKKLVIEKMNFKQKVLAFMMRFLNIPKMEEKAAIKTLYLTHLTFKENFEEKEQAINSLLFYLFKKKNSFHTIAFFTFPEWNLKKLPFIKTKTPAHFYQVLSMDQFAAEDFIRLENRPPAFEIGIS